MRHIMSGFIAAFVLSSRVFAQDAIPNPRAINSPEVSRFAQTVTITGLRMDPRGGIDLQYAQPLPKRWNCRPAGWDGDIQYTVWAFALVDGEWVGAGFVQMWEGRSTTDGSVPPILAGYLNWWGDPRRLWSNFSYYVPKPGDQVGFMVSACNARLTGEVTGLAERSNIVLVTLPPNDTGSFTFNAPPPPVPAPTPAPSPQPLPTPTPSPNPPPAVDLSAILTRLAQLESLTSDQHVRILDKLDSMDGKWESRWKAVAKWATGPTAAAIITWLVTRSGAPQP